MGRINKLSSIIDVIVFVATTLAIAGVFYEGMTRKWYDLVGILVVCMDYSFLLATIIHLVADRKEKRISEVQSRNAAPPIAVTVEGSLTSLSARHPSKARFEIVSSPSPKLTTAKFGHSPNAQAPILFTDAGIVTLFRFLQL